MRRIIFALILVASLAACAPALAPTIERANGDVIVTVSANQAVYAVSVSILDAVTDDARCATVGVDSWCLLGDLERGQVATVVATGEFGVACTAAGFLREDQALSSYRPFRCEVRSALTE